VLRATGPKGSGAEDLHFTRTARATDQEQRDMTISPRRLVLGAAAAGLLVSSVGATASPLPTPALAVAGPQGTVVGFASPYVVAVQGQALQFLNVDTVGHNITSVATKPKKVKYGKKTFIMRVPLFDSGSVAGAALGEVKGVSSLKPGSYAFYCNVHTATKGTLVVEATPAG
jgi:plastocyanin